MLDFKRLRSDQGFLVYVTQVYPAMKPYLKGFHLSLESWRGSHDTEGWKVRYKETKDKPPKVESETKEKDKTNLENGSHRMEDIKEELLSHVLVRESNAYLANGPTSGLTEAVPRLK